MSDVEATGAAIVETAPHAEVVPEALDSTADAVTVTATETAVVTPVEETAPVEKKAAEESSVVSETGDHAVEMAEKAEVKQTYVCVAIIALFITVRQEFGKN